MRGGSGGAGAGDVCKPARYTATGNIGPGGPTLILSMVLTGGSAAATADIREGGSGGTIVCSLAAPAGQWGGMEPAKPMFITDPHVTLTGAGASLNVAM